MKIACLLSLLLWSASAVKRSVGLRGLQDFDWLIEPDENYPQIVFNASTTDGELAFKYYYEGELGGSKSISSEFRQYDCLGLSDGAIVPLNADTSIPGELFFQADILQANITDSIHYIDLDLSTAFVSFCVRVDYNVVNLLGETESVNFHETKFTVTIDRTAGFEITGIVANRIQADVLECEASLDYAVEAYFCDEADVEIFPDPFAQGDFMQVCVRVDEEITTENIIVEDVVDFIISQPLGPGNPSIAVLDSQSDLLTTKRCSSNGICNIKTQLKSEYFVDFDPNDLLIDGTALVGFGGQRRLEQNDPMRTLQDCACVEPQVTNTQGVTNYAEFPLETVVVDANGAFVKFNVMQRWKDGDAISWVAADYYGMTGETCHTREGVSWTDVAQYTAQCTDGWAEVTLYVQDDSFDSVVDAAIAPERCEASSTVGNKVAVTVQVPCGCYASLYGQVLQLFSDQCTVDDLPSATIAPSQVLLSVNDAIIPTDPNCERRRMLVNFRGKLNDALGYDAGLRRHLQDGPQFAEDDDRQAPFNLTAPLIRTEAEEEEEITEVDYYKILITIVTVTTVVAIPCVFLFCLFLCCARRGRRNETVVIEHNMTMDHQYPEYPMEKSQYYNDHYSSDDYNH